MSRSLRLISILLLTLCLQWIVPPELLHSFCSHEDTIDHFHSEKGLTFSVHHQHCLVLEISLPPIWHEAKDVKFVEIQNFYFHQDYTVSVLPFVMPLVFEGRGPPVYC